MTIFIIISILAFCTSIYSLLKIAHIIDVLEEMQGLDYDDQDDWI